MGASCGLVVSSDHREVCSSLRELPACEVPLATVPVVSVIGVVILVSGVVSGDLVSGSPTVALGSLVVVSGNPTVVSGSLVVLSGYLTVVSGNPVVVFRRLCSACWRASSGFRRQGGSFLTFCGQGIWLMVIAVVIGKADNR